eukprot:CAMPEP_0198212190 /NCGR_PEP_ID=MMETSP1445-20131203/25574_1 /TAXON_ID=36898 /ORGANISM="Pyramimonas sp., Strain CCMP2087" /LENGTH=218 /DNA_ID=CAMNT_0043886585 /DNA_START=217 /DNA_END=873 /DNA_ORIENTATION=+
MPAQKHRLFRSANPTIILGSKSSIRRELLGELGELHGFSYSVKTADIDEKAIRLEKSEDLVLALAHAKALAIRDKLRDDEPLNSGASPTLLITCDQVVDHRGKILEKPETREEARENLLSYSTAPARTVASIVCTNLDTGYTCEGVDCSEVFFHQIPDAILEKLLEDEITYQVAGGLCIEHPLVAPLIKSLVGSMDSVQGFPKELVKRLLVEAYNSAP